jgi:uncharacterized RDD family membrane protein YckC
MLFVARLRVLSAALDAFLIAAAVDVPAVVVLSVFFLVSPTLPLVPVGLAACAASLVGFLLRDATGGLSRKWLGFRIEKEDGRSPGWLASVLRNLPTLVPGWNLYEAYRIWRHPGESRPVDRRLGLVLRREE